MPGLRAGHFLFRQRFAYGRSKNGVAALAHSRSKNGVASLAYSRSKNGVASLAYVAGVHVLTAALLKKDADGREKARP